MSSRSVAIRPGLTPELTVIIIQLLMEGVITREEARGMTVDED